MSDPDSDLDEIFADPLIWEGDCPNCGAKAEPPSALGPNVLSYECGSIGILGQPLRRVSPLCEARGTLLRLRNIVTTDHESKDAFIARVRAILDETPPATGGEV